MNSILFPNPEPSNALFKILTSACERKNNVCIARIYGEFFLNTNVWARETGTCR